MWNILDRTVVQSINTVDSNPSPAVRQSPKSKHTERKSKFEFQHNVLRIFYDGNIDLCSIDNSRPFG